MKLQPFLFFGSGRPNRSLEFTNAGNKCLNMTYASFGAYDTDTFSISMWVKSNGASANSTYLLGHYSGSASASAFYLFQNSGRLEVAYFNGSNTGQFVSTNTITSGWVHVVIHFDLSNGTAGNRIKMWINGVAETASTYSAPYTSMNAASGIPIAIGGRSTATSCFDGKLYQVGFFNNRLVDASILYNGGKPLDIRNQANLYSYIHTDDPNILDDYILATNWTNNNSVTLSTDTP